MSITIVSTWSEKNYQEYAKYFLESAKKYISEDINVWVYTDVPYTDLPGHFVNLPLEASCPDLVDFKRRNEHKKPTGKKAFMRDAVRFAHKSYAIIHASRTVNTDQLIWLDADTEILCPLTTDWFKSFLPKKYFCAYLGRDNKYSETGYLQFNLKKAKSFFDKWDWYYKSDEIYNLRAQLDCHVFDACLEHFPKLNGYNISPPWTQKRHFDIAFEKYMCHYKGSDKEKRDIYFWKATR